MNNHIPRYLLLALMLSVTAACDDRDEHASATTPGAPQASAPSAAETRWKVVQQLDYDWAGDGNKYEFTLSIPDPWDDAGDFTKLQITRHGKLVYELTDPSGLVKYRDELGGQMKKSAEGNLLPSPYLLMLPGPEASARPVLMVFGWAYASNPGSLRVIALGNDGIPAESLYLETFEATDYADLNHDARMELIGLQCSSEGFGPDLLTYAPYSVFRFGDAPGAAMTQDLALSERYNKKNYYGWAGPACRGDIAVVQHPPGGGKPVIMPTKEAEALFSKK